MNTSQAYIAVAIVALLAIVVLFLLRGKALPSERLTPLTGVAFAFVLASLLFGEDRVLGYSLMAVGVILAVIDIVRRSRRA